MSNKKNTVFFLHFRPITVIDRLSASRHSQAAATGGATVAYTYDDKGVKFAIAKVNPKDRYQKSIGRAVATERLSTEQAGYWPGSVHAFRQAIGFGLNA